MPARPGGPGAAVPRLHGLAPPPAQRTGAPRSDDTARRKAILNRRAAAVAAIVLLVLSGCVGAGEPSIRVAFLGDPAAHGTTDAAIHAVQGLELGLRRGWADLGLPGRPEVVTLDGGEDAERTLADLRELAEDPTLVAVVVPPFWTGSTGPSGVAPLPTVSLSPYAAPPEGDGRGRVFRVVADASAVASALAEAVGGSVGAARGVCLADDGSSPARTLADHVAGALGPSISVRLRVDPGDDAAPPVLAQEVRRAACGVVAWTGSGETAARLREVLDEARLGGVLLAGGDGLKDVAYLLGTEGEAEGTLAVCPCVDLTTSTDPVARRFVHGYQAEFGTPPGAYAAEAWDVGRILAAGIDAAGTDRTALAGWLAEADHPGLANRYSFGADGELAPEVATVRSYRAVGSLWLEAAPPVPPTRRPGVLRVAVCGGRGPFAEVRGGEARGFEPDVARAVAEELGLVPEAPALDCPARGSIRAPADVDAILLPPGLRLAEGGPTSRPVWSDRVAFVVDRSDDGAPGGPAALAPGDRVGAFTGSAVFAWAKRALPARTELRLFDDPGTAFDALARGRVEAVVSDEPTAQREVEDRPGLQAVASVDTGRRSRFAVPAGSAAEALVAALDDALARVIEGGAYARAHARWLPGVVIPPEILRADP